MTSVPELLLIAAKWGAPEGVFHRSGIERYRCSTLRAAETYPPETGSTQRATDHLLSHWTKRYPIHPTIITTMR
jgi:hypothetical protein